MPPNPTLQIGRVSLQHTRLPELGRLADAARPFYLWAESVFREVTETSDEFDRLLMTLSHSTLVRCIRTCYIREAQAPMLVDGVGRQYPHRKACFYFFAWLVRDAPQQRLQPIVARAVRDTSTSSRADVEIDALARLVVGYRDVLKTFAWNAVREVIMDRLEGSRRAIRGREKETVVRTALVAALQEYFERCGAYGRFASINVADSGVRVGDEEFDVVAEFRASDGSVAELLLCPVKTRETEGGGHSHIFTRDIASAIRAAQGRDIPAWIAAFIIAENWSAREQEHVDSIADLSIVLQVNPTTFESLETADQQRLSRFIAEVLDGTRRPRSAQSAS